MAQAVFVRGANVRGTTFRPSELPKRLKDLDLESIGAAGTFVVRASVSAAKARSEIAKSLPFKADIIVVAAPTLRRFVASKPFGDRALARGITAYVTVLASKPRTKQRYPKESPEGEWLVRLLGQDGVFVYSHQRRRGSKFAYPNEIIERTLGVRATTRNWNTMLAIDKKLAAMDDS